MKSADFWYAICVLASILAGAYTLKSYLMRLLAGWYGDGDSKKIKQRKVFDKNSLHYPYTAILTIDGMVCGNCAAHVENALNGIDGVWAKADRIQMRAVVRMKRKISDKDLRSAVNGLGSYTVLTYEQEPAYKQIRKSAERR